MESTGVDEIEHKEKRFKANKHPIKSFYADHLQISSVETITFFPKK